MRIREVLQQTSVIEYPADGQQVHHTVAAALRDAATTKAKITAVPEPSSENAALRIVVFDDRLKAQSAWKKFAPRSPADASSWMALKFDPDGGGILAVSRANLLYALARLLTDDWLDEPVAKFKEGRVVVPTFEWQRPLWDLFLTQPMKTIRRFDREAYVQEMARLGYTHLEVNGLAQESYLDAGVPGEVYPRFYTYCAALDQFVFSFLNEGIYPKEYLAANLNFLRRNADLARKYGLVPGMICFEPRSVPETLFERYPMLRGARVDHPFRSLKPRYNLTLAHPLVHDHYAEMMHKLMQAVPELGYISVWSNDSGAGYEYTNSLYVGRNGGAYLIREWKTHDEIARAAAGNAVGFWQTLRDAAAEVNPEFRVAIRLEPFTDERPHVWPELKDGIDAEMPTLLAAGWEMPYSHPEYDDVRHIGGSIYHNGFLEEEAAPMRELESRGGRFHAMYGHGPLNNFEPLLGVPAPWLAAEKIKALSRAKAKYLAHAGGIVPPSHAPWCIIHEVWRALQFNRDADVDEVVSNTAIRWVGEKHASDLVVAWRKAEESIRRFPPMMVYFSWGVWYRLLIRPLVPNIEAIPEADRAYYEDFMLTTPHNPTRVDLAKDVLFDLVQQDEAERNVSRIDDGCLPAITAALDVLTKALAGMPEDDAARAMFHDQRDRLRALRCWTRNQRNVAAWIAGVHGYLGATSKADRRLYRELVSDMVADEIENTRDLLELWETSDVEFMIVSEVGETTFIYGENFGDLLRQKIEVMTGREKDEPYIDPDFMMREAGKRT